MPAPEFSAPSCRRDTRRTSTAQREAIDARVCHRIPRIPSTQILPSPRQPCQSGPGLAPFPEVVAAMKADRGCRAAVMGSAREAAAGVASPVAQRLRSMRNRSGARLVPCSSLSHSYVAGAVRRPIAPARSYRGQSLADEKAGLTPVLVVPKQRQSRFTPFCVWRFRCCSALHRVSAIAYRSSSPCLL